MNRPLVSDKSLRIELLKRAKELGEIGEYRGFGDPRASVIARELLAEDRVWGKDCYPFPIITGIRDAGLQELRDSEWRGLLKRCLRSMWFWLMGILAWLFKYVSQLDFVRETMSGLVKALLR